MNWTYKGIHPAMQVPFHADHSIDEPALRAFAGRLAAIRGIGGLTTNGHTGEVFALDAHERAEVTRIVADEAKGRLPVVSGLCVEGFGEAEDHGGRAREAGASALLVMPPHGWLRFGMQPEHVVDYFAHVGKTSGLDLVVHVYPSWTRATYSHSLLAELARLPAVKAFKVGTRDMNKYAVDIRSIREAAPDKAVLTCHDEYLLASMVQGVDGALVGFASFIPEKIVALFEAVQGGDLRRAMQLQDEINPLKDVVYGFGEPTGDAHARMKYAMYRAGLFPAPTVRQPTRVPSGDVARRIDEALMGAGFTVKKAA
ncbi:MAG: dihydrodipicolinate synthase family protein [Proteobacteria bacterium]|nr:dihydrodipicolinate synthase family protein [Burkholderiales bacterium]